MNLHHVVAKSVPNFWKLMIFDVRGSSLDRFLSENFGLGGHTYRSVEIFFPFFSKIVASCYSKFVCFLFFVFFTFLVLIFIEKLQKKLVFLHFFYEFWFFGRHYSLEMWRQFHDLNLLVSLLNSHTVQGQKKEDKKEKDKDV